MGGAWAQARAARPARKPRTPLLLALVAYIGRVLPTWSKVRTTVMQVTAFGWLTWSAWQWSPIAGGVTIALSLLILETFGGSDRR